MSEKIPSQFEADSNEEKKRVLERIISLAQQIAEKGEVYQFPGIETKSHETLKADDDEYPGYTTHVDVILERMKSEGIKIVQANNPQSGNVFAMPAQSNDMSDSILINHLQVSDHLTKEVQELLLLTKK